MTNEYLLGYREIPGYPGYLINEQGILIDAVFNYCPIENRPPNSYRWYSLLRLRATEHTHRLLLLAFKGIDPLRRYGNHINGDKTYNPLENLEWVTPSENLIHAFETGLRSDNQPMVIYNCETSETVRKYSLNAAARFMLVNPEKLHRYLKGPRTRLLSGRYVVARVFEDINALVLNIEPVDDSGKIREVRVFDASTGKEYVFASGATAARFFDITSRLVYRLLRSSGEYNGLTFTYADACHGLKVISDLRPIKPPKRKPLRVTCHDTVTGATTLHDSLKELADILGVKFPALQKSVYLKGGWRNYQIEYINEVPSRSNSGRKSILMPESTSTDGLRPNCHSVT